MQVGRNFNCIFLWVGGSHDPFVLTVNKITLLISPLPYLRVRISKKYPFFSFGFFHKRTCAQIESTHSSRIIEETGACPRLMSQHLGGNGTKIWIYIVLHYIFPSLNRKNANEEIFCFHFYLKRNIFKELNATNCHSERADNYAIKRFVSIHF